MALPATRGELGRSGARALRGDGPRLLPDTPRRPARLRRAPRRGGSGGTALRSPLPRRLRRAAAPALSQAGPARGLARGRRLRRRLDGIDPQRIILWGFSFSGGHVVETAAADPRIAATIALCPMVDGLARALATPPLLSAWLIPRALADQFGRHNVVAVTGQPGEHAAMTLAGEADGFAAAVPVGSPWRNEISPGVFLTVAIHRPLAKARRIHCPLWSVSVRATSRSRGEPSKSSPNGRPGGASPLPLRPLRRLPR